MKCDTVETKKWTSFSKIFGVIERYWGWLASSSPYQSLSISDLKCPGQHEIYIFYSNVEGSLSVSQVFSEHEIKPFVFISFEWGWINDTELKLHLRISRFIFNESWSRSRLERTCKWEELSNLESNTYLCIV